VNEQLLPYADIIALLQQWSANHKQRHAPELIALQQIDQARLATALRLILADAEKGIQFSVVDALPSILPVSIMTGLLVPYLRDPHSDLRWTLCELFHAYPDPRAVLPLAQVLLEDTDPDVRCVAAEALSAVGDERAIPALCYASTHDTGKDYEDRSIADAAREALTAIQQRHKQKVQDQPT
jgi:HEAT repeat protein